MFEGLGDYVGIENRESFEQLRDALGGRPVNKDTGDFFESLGWKEVPVKEAAEAMHAAPQVKRNNQSLFAQYLEGAELVERMQGLAMDVLGGRVLLGKTAGVRRRHGARSVTAGLRGVPFCLPAWNSSPSGRERGPPMQGRATGVCSRGSRGI